MQHGGQQVIKLELDTGSLCVLVTSIDLTQIRVLFSEGLGNVTNVPIQHSQVQKARNAGQRPGAFV
jgi:hypothetical protein